MDKLCKDLKHIAFGNIVFDPNRPKADCHRLLMMALDLRSESLELFRDTSWDRKEKILLCNCSNMVTSVLNEFHRLSQVLDVDGDGFPVPPVTFRNQKEMQRWL